MLSYLAKRKAKRGQLWRIGGVLLACGLAAGQARATARVRQPIPSPAQQKRAQAQLRRAIPRRFWRHTPATTVALGQYLYAHYQGGDASSAVRYVALQAAVKLACQAGDPPTAMHAMAALIKNYQVSADNLNLALYRRLAALKNLGNFADPVATHLLGLARQAMHAKHFAVAGRFLQLAQPLVLRRNQLAEVEEVRRLLRRASFDQMLQTRYRQLAAWLKRHPQDGDGALARAAYLFSIHKQVQGAVRYLQRSGQPAARQLAAVLTRGSAVGELRAGDGWWRLAGRGATAYAFLLKTAATAAWRRGINQVPAACAAALTNRHEAQAIALLKRARAAAQRSGAGDLIALTCAWYAGIGQVQAAYRAYEQAKRHLATGKISPVDSQVIGAYNCFVQSRWTKGLARLARGANRRLAQVATLGLEPGAAATYVRDQLFVANSWWRIAGGYNGLLRYNIERHALIVYAAVYPDLSPEWQRRVRLMLARFNQGRL